MKLLPKTHKAKNKIHEAGTDQWRIIQASESVICLGGAAGLLIEPVVKNGGLALGKRRWILKLNDPDFDYQES